MNNFLCQMILKDLFNSLMVLVRVNLGVNSNDGVLLTPQNSKTVASPFYFTILLKTLPFLGLGCSYPSAVSVFYISLTRQNKD